MQNFSKQLPKLSMNPSEARVAERRGPIWEVHILPRASLADKQLPSQSRVRCFTSSDTLNSCRRTTWADAWTDSRPAQILPSVAAWVEAGWAEGEEKKFQESDSLLGRQDLPRMAPSRVSS